MIVSRANADTTSHRGKSQGIEHHRGGGRMLRGNTVRGDEAGPRKGSKQRAHLKRSAN
jgi:hypothetical protein